MAVGQSTRRPALSRRRRGPRDSRRGRYPNEPDDGRGEDRDERLRQASSSRWFSCLSPFRRSAPDRAEGSGASAADDALRRNGSPATLGSRASPIFSSLISATRTPDCDGGVATGSPRGRSPGIKSDRAALRRCPASSRAGRRATIADHRPVIDRCLVLTVVASAIRSRRTPSSPAAAVD